MRGKSCSKLEHKKTLEVVEGGTRQEGMHNELRDNKQHYPFHSLTSCLPSEQKVRHEIQSSSLHFVPMVFLLILHEKHVTTTSRRARKGKQEQNHIMVCSLPSFLSTLASQANDGEGKEATEQKLTGSLG